MSYRASRAVANVISIDVGGTMLRASLCSTAARLAPFLTLILLFAACGQPEDAVEGTEEERLQICARGHGLDPRELPINLDELDQEATRVLEICLAEQGLTLEEANSRRRSQVERANQELLAELSCMKSRGWIVPQPRVGEGGILVIGDYDQYEPQGREAFIRDHEQCARSAHGQTAHQHGPATSADTAIGHDHNHHN